MAVTWTLQYQKTIFEDTIGVLGGLDRDGKQNYGSLRNYFPKNVSASRRQNVMDILRDIDFVFEERNPGTKLYEITPIGKFYYEEISEDSKKNIFHSQLYQNILHYSYAYDYLLENDFFVFEKEELIEKLVLSSSNDFGTRIYDWKSGEYVLSFMKDLNIVLKEDEKYFLNEQYKRKFLEKEFIEIIYNSFEKEKLQYTKSLCENLIRKSNKFMVSKNPPTMSFIYKKLLKTNEIKEFVNFIPGLPRPPIPSKHTLIELK